jgi:phosphotriesterase-related protein
MGKYIRTVTGEMPPEALGVTSMHDHVFVGVGNALQEGGYIDQYAAPILEHFGGELPFEPGEISLRNLRALYAGAFIPEPSYWDWTDPDIAREELELYRDAGGDCIVSVSTKAMSRKAGEMRRLSEETGVTIVAATGLYAHEVWPPEYFEMSVDDMVAFILDEVENGLDDTDVKPGIIKAAANVLDDPTLRALTACARAQAETGLAMMVHNGLELSIDDSWEMLGILVEAGADPERLIWGHSQNLAGNRDLAGILRDPDSFTIDIDFLARVADEGVTICVDTFGMVTNMELVGFIEQPEIQQAIIVAKMMQAGYGDRVVVGHDASWKLCASRYAGTGFTRVPDWLLPNLRAAGYPDDQVDRIATGNPARLLSV